MIRYRGLFDAFPDEKKRNTKIFLETPIERELKYVQEQFKNYIRYSEFASALLIKKGHH